MNKRNSGPRSIPSGELTAKMVMECIDYDPRTGVMTRRWQPDLRPSDNARWAGTVAGFYDEQGYRLIRIYGRIYKASRIAWLISTGEWPEHTIDHVNCIRDDNRICNLRAATRSQNKMNSGPYSNNSSGLKGTYYVKSRRKWRAEIRANGERTALGEFNTAEAAHSAYCRAAIHLHGQFVNTGSDPARG